MEREAKRKERWKGCGGREENGRGRVESGRGRVELAEKWCGVWDRKAEKIEKKG